MKKKRIRALAVAATAVYDDVLLMDATAGALTVTLPAAAGQTGNEVFVQKTDASANAVTIDAAGAEVIRTYGLATATTLVLRGENHSALLVSNGTQWEVANVDQGDTETLIAD